MYHYSQSNSLYNRINTDTVDCSSEWMHSIKDTQSGLK